MPCRRDASVTLIRGVSEVCAWGGQKLIEFNDWSCFNRHGNLLSGSLLFE